MAIVTTIQPKWSQHGISHRNRLQGGILGQPIDVHCTQLPGLAPEIVPEKVGRILQKNAGFVGVINTQRFPTWWFERKGTHYQSGCLVDGLRKSAQMYLKRLKKHVETVETTHLIIIIGILADQSLRHWNTANVGRSGHHPICRA
jgi:hypothetical protein